MGKDPEAVVAKGIEHQVGDRSRRQALVAPHRTCEAIT